MRKHALILIITAATTCATATAQTDTLQVDTTYNLGGITVKTNRKIQKADRQLFIPSKQAIRSSSNGYELLRLMKLDGIKVDPIQQNISSLGGGNVEVRINDVKANTQDIMALQPDEVIRVEYIDNPGVRYSDGGLDAVINYVVRRRYAGYVGGLSTSQAFTTGFNNSSAYFKYNHRKSEFGVLYGFSYRGYDGRKYDEKADFYFPDGTEHHRNQKGYDTNFMYTTNFVQLSYNLAEPDKYVFNARFNYNGFNSPYRGTNGRITETGQPDLYSFNEIMNKQYTPSLDIYYSVNLPHDQNIMANVVGTYIKSDHRYLMREYLFNLSPAQSMQSTPLNDYSYTTKGKKYSLISEAIYTKSFKRHSLSAGGNFSVSRTDNRYAGNVGTHAKLNSNNLYLFAQMQGRLAWLNYQVGIGANRASIHQDGLGFEKWTFRPKVTLQTSAIKNVSIRLSGEVGQHTPSLSQLSDVRQQSSSLMASDGNTGLTPYSSYQSYLTVTWNHPVISLWANGGLAYEPDIIMNSLTPELQDNGKYLIIRHPENQRALIQKWARINVTLHAIRDMLDFSVYGAFQRYDSRGLDYRHTFNSWQVGADASLTLKGWTVMAHSTQNLKATSASR